MLWDTYDSDANKLEHSFTMLYRTLGRLPNKLPHGFISVLEEVISIVLDTCIGFNLKEVSMTASIIRVDVIYPCMLLLFM